MDRKRVLTIAIGIVMTAVLLLVAGLRTSAALASARATGNPQVFTGTVLTAAGSPAAGAEVKIYMRPQKPGPGDAAGNSGDIFRGPVVVPRSRLRFAAEGGAGRRDSEHGLSQCGGNRDIRLIGGHRGRVRLGWHRQQFAGDRQRQADGHANAARTSRRDWGAGRELAAGATGASRARQEFSAAATPTPWSASTTPTGTRPAAFRTHAGRLQKSAATEASRMADSPSKASIPSRQTTR